MPRRHLSLSTSVLVCCLAALPARAQDAPLPTAGPPPANLTFIEGTVDLIHEGAAERATPGLMLVDGDLVRTSNGRAEIVFADGTLLHLDHDSELELLSPLRLRLRSGRVILRVSAAATSPYLIDTPAATVRFEARGEYALNADSYAQRLELAVTRGVAEIDDGSTRTDVHGGEAASILGAGGRVLVQAFNSARWDAFERWSSDRTNGYSTAMSSRLLPSELRPYGGVLDSYGRWDYVLPYGNVWFPSVGADWRPYYSGSWSLTRYGWTWVGIDPWAWPTHHFGRWGFTGSAWYWIPNRVWGPAWVSWSFIPGYVSWCPLGWDGRAVVGFSGRPGDHPAYWPNYRPRYDPFDPWRAWTIVPRDAFGGRRSVRTHAIDPGRLPDQARRAMMSMAVPRGTVGAPAASATIRSVPADRDLAIPRAVVVPHPSPGSVRRENGPREYPPEYRPRGNVRSLTAPPTGQSTSPMPYTPTPSIYPAPPPVQPRPTYQLPPSYQPSPTYGVPRNDDRAVERGVPSTRGRDETESPRLYAPRPEQSHPQRQDSPPRGGQRAPGVAAPRSPSEGTQATPPPRGAGRPETGSAAGARRRPQ